MKKLLWVSALCVGSSAFAADMRCNVGPYTELGYCDTILWNQNSAEVSFSIENLFKPVAQVIWQSPSACKNKTTAYCNFHAYSFVQYHGSALVLYTDGTYESVSASLRFEDGR